MQFLIGTTLLVASVLSANDVGYYANKQHLRVLTIVNPPFVSQGSDGNLTGLVIDLLDLVAASVGFTYDIALQPDNIYGIQQADGSWNGLVGSLLTGKADVVAADFTITSARDEVIDFSTPFSQFNLRIMFNTATGLNDVKYQVLRDTSFQAFLQSATSPSIQAIWNNIQANNGLVESADVAIANVLAGGFAYIDDQSFLLAAVRANPTRLQLDRRVLLTEFNAFGVRQDSELRDQIGIAVSRINQIGQLRKLLVKYNIA